MVPRACKRRAMHLGCAGWAVCTGLKFHRSGQNLRNSPLSRVHRHAPRSWAGQTYNSPPIYAALSPQCQCSFPTIPLKTATDSSLSHVQRKPRTSLKHLCECLSTTCRSFRLEISCQDHAHAMNHFVDADVRFLRAVVQFWALRRRIGIQGTPRNPCHSWPSKGSGRETKSSALGSVLAAQMLHSMWSVTCDGFLDQHVATADRGYEKWWRRRWWWWWWWWRWCWWWWWWWWRWRWWWWWWWWCHDGGDGDDDGDGDNGEVMMMMVTMMMITMMVMVMMVMVMMMVMMMMVMMVMMMMVMMVMMVMMMMVMMMMMMMLMMVIMVMVMMIMMMVMMMVMMMMVMMVLMMMVMMVMTMVMMVMVMVMVMVMMMMVMMMMMMMMMMMWLI